MSKLMKCKACGEYTLKDKCSCGGEVKDAHYKFVKIRDAPKSDGEFWLKKQKC